MNNERDGTQKIMHRHKMMYRVSDTAINQHLRISSDNNKHNILIVNSYNTGGTT